MTIAKSLDVQPPSRVLHRDKMCCRLMVPPASNVPVGQNSLGLRSKISFIFQ